MLRNIASGSEIELPSRISAGLAGRRADFNVFPNRIRPQSGPEDRFPAWTRIAEHRVSVLQFRKSRPIRRPAQYRRRVLQRMLEAKGPFWARALGIPMLGLLRPARSHKVGTTTC